MTPLTARQREILALIRREVRERGAPPTRAEIATAFGFRSANAADAHLRALARKGVIELVGGLARGIRLCQPAEDESDTGAIANAAAQVGLPLIGRVAAGSPILADAHIEARYPVDLRLFARRPDYLLRVRGWSMRDAGIWEGDLLAIHATREVREGQTVVARLHDEVTVKQWARAASGWLLRSANPDFPDRPVRPGEPFEIEGVVGGLLRQTGWD